MPIESVDFVKPFLDEDLACNAIQPISSENTGHHSGTVLNHILVNAVSTLDEVVNNGGRMCGSSGLGGSVGSTGGFGSVSGSFGAGPSPSDAYKNPDYNNMDPTVPVWLSNDPSMPISDIWQFPGGDWVSAYVRFVSDMSYSPSRLGYALAFWRFLAQASKAGAFQNPAFVNMVFPASGPGGMDILKDALLTFIISEQNKDTPVGALNVKIAGLLNQFGNDPVSSRIKAELSTFLSSSELQKALIQYKGKSASQVWGALMTNGLMQKIKAAAFKASIERLAGSGNLNLLITYLFMMKECTYEDQIPAYGDGVESDNALQRKAKQVMDDFTKMRQLDGPDQGLTDEIAKLLGSIHDELEGSYCDDSLKTQLESELSTIFNIKMNADGTGLTIWEAYKNGDHAGVAKRLFDIYNQNKKKSTFGDDPKPDPTPPIGPSDESQEATDIQRAMSGIISALGDKNQTTAAIISNIVNMSKSLQTSLKTVFDSFNDGKTTSIKNQIV